ncbi:hypothetical protein OXX79_006603 [Metschnikowia pulcherrima]
MCEGGSLETGDTSTPISFKFPIFDPKSDRKHSNTEDHNSSISQNVSRKLSGKTSYKPNGTPERTSLSMKIMHKPPRSQNELVKASDPTRRNSLLNSLVPDDHEDNTIPSTDDRASIDPLSPNLSSSVSPQLSPSRQSLVRKKSGEIVKPLLKERGASISLRSRSLPSTPTYKQVHFGGDADIRYFKKKDRPTAISASNSPNSYDEDDAEDFEIPGLDFEFESHSSLDSLFDSSKTDYFDYYDDELNSHVEHDKSYERTRRQCSAFDWKLELLNFTQVEDLSHPIHAGKSVFLENIFLSADKRYLLGQIAVHNLAYEKAVIVRYSLDKWCTIVEIQAAYIPDTPRALKVHNYDRFMFKLSLDSFVNGFVSGVDLLSHTDSELKAELCVRYHVNGSDLWDNNDGRNYLFRLQRSSHQNPPQEIPTAARTKHETHENRPKYSSSYLKKIKSDSALSTHMGSSSNENSTPMACAGPQANGAHTKNCSATARPTHNDFESNNYYLSSPLFSSFSNKSAGVDLGEDAWNGTFDRSILNSSTSPDSHDATCHTDMDEVRPASRQFGPDSSSHPLGRMSRDLHEPTTYKNFLDSYCFFNSSINDNNSKTTLVMSDAPSTAGNSRAAASDDVNANADHIYSVSSFLT